MAKALAEAVSSELTARASEGSQSAAPKYEVEVERFAAAWWLAGLPVPEGYDSALARPDSEEKRLYMRERGKGDGRRIDEGVVPRLIRQRAATAVGLAAAAGDKESAAAGRGASRGGAEDGMQRHRTWYRESATPELCAAVIPVVGSRGIKLASAAAALRAREVAEQATQEMPTLDMSAMRGQDVILVVPARKVGGRLSYLVPASGGDTLLGLRSEVAVGDTSAMRKECTALAERLVREVYGPEADLRAGSGARTAPVAWRCKLGDAEATVVAAWVPREEGAAERRCGLVWRIAALLGGRRRAEVCKVVQWRADGWLEPQRDLQVPLKLGAVGPVSTRKDGVGGAPPIDRRKSEVLLSRDMATLDLLLEQAARREEHVAPQLRAWRGKIAEDNKVLPPPAVAACAVQPKPEHFLRRPFSRRCSIPTTAPMEQRWPPPRWPVGVPRPVSALATYMPEHRRGVEAQWERVRGWSAKCVGGDSSGRPQSRSWSDEARLPWLRGRRLLFTGDRCELLGAGGPALDTRMHKAAWLYLFRDYPHRRLLSYGIHGVRMGDTLEPNTTIASNLFALYEVEGGADAVADEMHVLKERGWLRRGSGSASETGGAFGTRGSGGGDGARRSGGSARPSPQLASPIIVSPRSAVARKDGGPPRGVSEDGHPRKILLTEDTGMEVDSINNSSGKRAGLGGPLRDIFPLDETKPTAEDACTDLCILWCLADLLRVTIIMLLFDFKYFFHILAYEMAEVWKRGFAVPSRARGGGAHPSELDSLLELVMSMGWTRASLIAQDLANALVWKLLRLVDKELEGHVRRLREANPAFNEAWEARLAILVEDEYGTHARLVMAMEYTDDMLAAGAGPEATAALTVCFCRLIGPPLYMTGDAAEAARGTARRHAALTRGESVPVGMTRPRRGGIRALPRSGRPREGELLMCAARVSPGGNPFDGPDAKAATVGFACLLACGEQNVAVDEVARLRRLSVHERQARVTQEKLWPFLRRLEGLVADGNFVAVRCGCEGMRTGDPCHLRVVCDHVEQQLDIAEDVRRGPPVDPVVAEPVEAYGLDLEAAKPHKWGLGAFNVWIGVGLSSTLLVSWVPQNKALALLMTTRQVLEGRCPVGLYRRYLGALQDAVKATGGGWYMMKGMHVPLQDGQEIDKGPDTLVALRRQMSARLRAWQQKLANCPGASMLAAIAPAPQPAGAVKWEIGGDAACESRRKGGGLEA